MSDYPMEDRAGTPVSRGDADKSDRASAAREKAAAAAKAAADRRQSQSYSEMSPTPAASRSRSETPTPIVVKRRSTGGAELQNRVASVPQTDAYVAPAREDHEANARQMSELRAAIAQLEEEDESIEERLQLYSEVIGLRKELQVVQEDEDRLRQQRDNTERIVAAHDPEIGKELSVLEDQAQQSSLLNIWKEESAIHNPEKMDWATIDITNLSQRVVASKKAFYAANQAAEDLLAKQEAKINEHTDSREKTKESLQESFAEEMSNLGDVRHLVKQVDSEQRFHQRRGTNRGRTPAVSGAKLQSNRERRVDQAENRTTQQVEEMSSQLTDLMEECKVLKKQLDESKRISGERQQVLETQLKGVEEEGVEARAMKEKLEKEKEELAALKADLQGVLHYVRAKNREEEDF